MQSLLKRKYDIGDKVTIRNEHHNGCKGRIDAVMFVKEKSSVYVYYKITLDKTKEKLIIAESSLFMDKLPAKLKFYTKTGKVKYLDALKIVRKKK